jgi:molybdenum cofactor cytidylyltransferase
MLSAAVLPESWSNALVRIVAIVLAAGEGRRVGGPKALLQLGSDTFLARVCATLARPGVDAVVAVLGAEAARVRHEGGVPAGVDVVVNDVWRDGMLSSVWRGLDRAEALGADAVLLHPVDNPFVAPATVEAVVSALEAGAAIAVPTSVGRRGHPAGFARALFEELRRAAPERGARVVVAADPARVVHVPGDPGCVRSVDTPDDLARING